WRGWFDHHGGHRGGGGCGPAAAGVQVVDRAGCTAQTCRSCVAVTLADAIALGCCPCAVVSVLGPMLAFVQAPLAVARRCLCVVTTERVAASGRSRGHARTAARMTTCTRAASSQPPGRQGFPSACGRGSTFGGGGRGSPRRTSHLGVAPHFCSLRRRAELAAAPCAELGAGPGGARRGPRQCHRWTRRHWPSLSLLSPSARPSPAELGLVQAQRKDLWTRNVSCGKEKPSHCS
ncbi:uncharacterized protein LOC120647827, partial [Panicum virgatum]|uniref:uncharacterized protein LOC120647827 n=1 Tax=Panicum virgatum TaxID=38727 RepID=UPI0019D6704D